MTSRPRPVLVTAGLLIASGLAALAPSPAGAAATCYGQPATITASNQPSVTGTAGNDVIVTDRVARIDAGDGADLICSTHGPNRDVTIDAGPGNDRLLTTGGPSYTLDLGAGADLLRSTATGVVELDAGDETPGFAPAHDVMILGSSGDTVVSGARTAANDDDLVLGRGGGEVTIKGRFTGTYDGGGGAVFTDLDAAGGSWTIDLARGRGTVNGAAFLLKRPGILVLDGLDWQRLKVRGSKGTDYVADIERDKVRGPVDIRLGGGKDFAEFEGPLRGRIDGGAGPSDFFSLNGESNGSKPTTSLSLGLLKAKLSTVGNGRRIKAKVPGWEDFRFDDFRKFSFSGSPRRDKIFVAACDIDLSGGAGNDKLEAFGLLKEQCRRFASGAVVAGGVGDDRLVGGRYNDLLVGGPGRDFADGEEGRNRCVGTEAGPC